MTSNSTPFGDTLRPYAVRPDYDAAFDLPLHPSAPSTAPSTSTRVTAAPASSRLSPLATADTYIDLDEPSTSFLRSATAAGLLGFASTALVMPFDVGKTLLQVQYIPKDDVDTADLEPEERDAEEEAEVRSDLFPSSPSLTRYRTVVGRGRSGILLCRIDVEGGGTSITGVVCTSTEGSTRLRRSHFGLRRVDQARILAAGRRDRRDLGYDQGYGQEQARGHHRVMEGWAPSHLVASQTAADTPAGQLTTFAADSLTSLLQPAFTSLFTSVLAPSLAALTLLESPRPGTSLLLELASRSLTTFLLSPLDLIRTRLIVQSSSPRFRKYRGPWHALQHLIEEEGGLHSLYFHSNLFFPTLLEATFRPLLHLGVPLALDRLLRLRAEKSPLAYGLAEFTLSTLSLLVILPIETIRRRLQVQSRSTTTSGSKRPYRACIETRNRPYAGIVDAAYRIVTEETSSLPPHIAARRGKSRRKGSEEEIVKGNGLGQLFRGFGVGVFANAVVLVLGFVSPGERLL